MSDKREIKVTIELPNVHLWNDWEQQTEKEVLEQLEVDIKNILLNSWCVDEVGEVKADLLT